MQLHLHSYGTYLHVKDEMFEIKVPAQASGTTTFKKHLAAKKVKSMWLSPHTALSSAAVGLALKFNIDIVFLENNGQPLGRVWHSKLGSTTFIRKQQLTASLDERAAIYTKKWLCAKLDNQLSFIQSLGKHRKSERDNLDKTAEQIAGFAQKINDAPAERIESIADSFRGWEGTAGRLYFETLARIIPEQYKFSGRSFRPAQDVFNAFLNYGYGILYSRTERALMLAGLDPYVGFLHRDDYNHRSMVYDFIEPFRTFIDKPIFQLFTAKKVRQDHWIQFEKGVGMTKEGKVLCVEAVNRYLEEEKIKFRGRHRCRADVMQAEAYSFAGELIGRTKEESIEVDITVI